MKHSSSTHDRGDRGFVALVTILIATAAALIIGTSVILKTVSESSAGLDQQYAAQTWSAANGCAEYALGLLTLSPATTTWNSYAGTHTPSVSYSGSNSCTVSLIGSNSNTLTNPIVIQAQDTVSGFVSKIEVSVATNTPAVQISSWNEVASF